jgi:hypothetical protein
LSQGYSFFQNTGFLQQSYCKAWANYSHFFMQGNKHVQIKHYFNHKTEPQY